MKSFYIIPCGEENAIASFIKLIVAMLGILDECMKLGKGNLSNPSNNFKYSFELKKGSFIKIYGKSLPSIFYARMDIKALSIRYAKFLFNSHF